MEHFAAEARFAEGRECEGPPGSRRHGFSCWTAAVRVQEGGRVPEEFEERDTHDQHSQACLTWQRNIRRQDGLSSGEDLGR